MKEKKVHYTQEISEIFENSSDIKSAEKLAKDIKKVQEKSFPSKKYVSKLRENLYGIHAVDQALDESSSSISLYKLFGIIGSSVFIFLALFFVYDMRTDMQKNPIIKPVLDSDIPKEVMEIHNRALPTNEALEEMQREEEPDQTEILETSTRLGDDTPENTSQNVDSYEGGNIENSSEDTSVVDSPINEAKQSPQQEQNRAVPAGQEENMKQTISSQGASSSESYNPSYSDEDFSTNDSEDVYYEDSQAIYEYEMERFIEICQSNGGNIEEDNYTCSFPGGNICSSDNIYPEASKPCEYLYGSDNSGE